MRIEFELAEKVWNRLSREAEENGISAEELARYILGSAMVDSAMDRKNILLQMARGEELKCVSCENLLTGRDVVLGLCSKCEAPITN